ncbi:MAG: hypothetical protein IPK19_33520 [Chloroflexi bacterium]|nr:hypothetical protein [Chloroflexota bacterium]
MLKRYATPNLTVFGPLENLTTLTLNGSSLDQACGSGANFSDNPFGSQACFVPPAPEATTVPADGGVTAPITVPELPVDLELVSPELAQELTDLSTSGGG